MSVQTEPYDSAEYLDTAEAVQEYVASAFESGDPAHIAYALGVAARAGNMTRLADQIGMSRSALYRALSGDTRPEFATILKVADALGLRMTVVPKTPNTDQTAA